MTADPAIVPARSAALPLDLSDAERALVMLSKRLRAEGYRFVTPTPDTHRRMIARFTRRRPGDLRDVFGWSQPFRERDIEPDILALMEAGGIVDKRGGSESTNGSFE